MSRRRLCLNSQGYFAILLTFVLVCSGTGCQLYGRGATALYGRGATAQCASCSGPMVDAGCDSCGTACGGGSAQFPGTCGTCAPAAAAALAA